MRDSRLSRFFRPTFLDTWRVNGANGDYERGGEFVVALETPALPDSWMGILLRGREFQIRRFFLRTIRDLHTL